VSAAYAVSFFDPDRELYGTVRSGATILFEGRSPAAHAEEAQISADGDGWTAELHERLSLRFAPLSPEIELGLIATSLCRVEGQVGGRAIDCLGTLAITREPPRWEELDAVRSISALVDDSNALFAVAQRPRGAAGHGQELVHAAMFKDAELLPIEDARVSTVYDGDGRQRSAGLELWPVGEEFSRRGSGQLIAGSSLELEAVRVHAAVFRWRIEGREGIGAYELMVRNEPPAAA
jgi:hypothetical protein